MRGKTLKIEHVYNQLEYDKPKNKYTIASDLMIDERNVRKAVELLRKNGYMIISNSQTNGFYLPSNDKKGLSDVMHLKAETINRKNKLDNIIKCCDKWINEYNQIKLESDI